MNLAIRCAWTSIDALSQAPARTTSRALAACTGCARSFFHTARSASSQPLPRSNDAHSHTPRDTNDAHGHTPRGGRRAAAMAELKSLIRKIVNEAEKAGTDTEAQLAAVSDVLQLYESAEAQEQRMKILDHISNGVVSITRVIQSGEAIMTALDQLLQRCTTLTPAQWRTCIETLCQLREFPRAIAVLNRASRAYQSSRLSKYEQVKSAHEFHNVARSLSCTLLARLHFWRCEHPTLSLDHPDVAELVSEYRQLIAAMLSLRVCENADGSSLGNSEPERMELHCAFHDIKGAERLFVSTHYHIKQNKLKTPAAQRLLKRLGLSLMRLHASQAEGSNERIIEIGAVIGGAPLIEESKGVRADEKREIVELTLRALAALAAIDGEHQTMLAESTSKWLESIAAARSMALSDAGLADYMQLTALCSASISKFDASQCRAFIAQRGIDSRRPEHSFEHRHFVDGLDSEEQLRAVTRADHDEPLTEPASLAVPCGRVNETHAYLAQLDRVHSAANLATLRQLIRQSYGGSHSQSSSNN